MVAPRLSVVVGTTEGWPYVKACLDSFREEATALGAEVVVADGSGLPPPPPAEVAPGTVWMSSASRDIFRLFYEGLKAARGEVVASTEDHCRVRPGWCGAILRAHAEHPEAAAIGGAIENGTPISLLDWGSFFITQGIHMAPLGQRETPVTTNEACLSQKRWALAELSDNGGHGAMMILHTRVLRERGAILRVDDRFAVDHDQGLDARGTFAIHFHNGRAIATFRRRAMQRSDWLRLGGAGLVPLYRVARMFRTLLRKRRHTRELVLSVPWQVWLEYCQSAGFVMGYLAGPGDSLRHLR